MDDTIGEKIFAFVMILVCGVVFTIFLDNANKNADERNASMNNCKKDDNNYANYSVPNNQNPATYGIKTCLDSNKNIIFDKKYKWEELKTTKDDFSKKCIKNNNKLFKQYFDQSTFFHDKKADVYLCVNNNKIVDSYINKIA